MHRVAPVRVVREVAQPVTSRAHAAGGEGCPVEEVTPGFDRAEWEREVNAPVSPQEEAAMEARVEAEIAEAPPETPAEEAAAEAALEAVIAQAVAEGCA